MTIYIVIALIFSTITMIELQSIEFARRFQSNMCRLHRRNKCKLLAKSNMWPKHVSLYWSRIALCNACAFYFLFLSLPCGFVNGAFSTELIFNLRNQIPDVDRLFTIHRRIGEGTFSSVFLASVAWHRNRPMNKRRVYAIKHLIPTTHPRRVAQELICLKEMG